MNFKLCETRRTAPLIYFGSYVMLALDFCEIYIHETCDVNVVPNHRRVLYRVHDMHVRVISVGVNTLSKHYTDCITL